MEKKPNPGSSIAKEGNVVSQSQINVRDGFEVRYWAKAFDVSAEQIKSAVRKVGPALDDVRRELKREGL
ncbi:MAG: DUF3606 domain-containing protein [Burkholderiales bacterium]